MSDILIELE